MERRTGEDGSVAQGGDFTSDPRRLVNVTKERRVVRGRAGRKIYRAKDEGGEKVLRNYYTLGDRHSGRRLLLFFRNSAGATSLPTQPGIFLP